MASESENDTKTVEFKSMLAALDRSQAVIHFDLDGMVLDANDNFLSVMGYARDEVVGAHHSVFCPPEFVDSREYKALWASLKRGEFTGGEFRRLSRDGQDVWIQATYNPVIGTDGKPFRVVKFATDITDQKTFSASLEGKFRAIDRSQAVIEFDVEGRILDANENFCRALGYVQSDIVGQHHSIFCESEYVESEPYRAFWRRLAAGDYASGEFKRLSKDGEEVWIQATYNPILNATGQTVRVIKFASNITEIKKLSIEANAKINAIERSQAVIEFDLQGTVMDANDNFLRVMGYTRSEIIGKHHQMFCDRSFVKTREYTDFWFKLSQGEFFSGQFLRMNKHGRPIWIQATYNPILDEAGAPVKVIKFATDITDQIVLENQVRDHANGMRQSIRDLRGSIETAADGTRAADTLAKVNETEARGGSEAIDRSIESMRNIQTSTDEIAEIVNLIEDLATQTNMLAFNAAIEAARAGEHGLGFSVVADEVRKLAERSTTATKDINRLIRATVERVSEGNQVSQSAATSFRHINDGVARSTRSIADIREASEDQLAAIQSVSAAIDALVGAVNTRPAIEGEAPGTATGSGAVGIEDEAA